MKSLNNRQKMIVAPRQDARKYTMLVKKYSKLSGKKLRGFGSPKGKRKVT